MSISRRDFLKAAAAVGGVAALGWVVIRQMGNASLRPSRHVSPRRTERPRSRNNRSDEDLFEAMYYEKMNDKRVVCRLCFNECLINDGGRGVCEARENRDGKLYSLVHNRPCAIQVDPIEKEPLHHFHPASTIFCLSTASCNYRCRFCHNWHISFSSPEQVTYRELTAREIVEWAKELECPGISHTFGEPTIHYEYMLEVAKEARKAGLRWIFHTNLGMMPEPLKEILPYTDAMSIDLKGFCEDYYRRLCNARLDRVLENLKLARESGVYFELVNLVLPDQNDDPDMIREMSLWIKENLGADTPLHLSRFSPTHQFRELPPTPIRTLERCHEIARNAGLNFVSIGNVPGHEANSTYCPDCGKRVVHRRHFSVRENLVKDGKCPDCERELPGVWS